MRSHDHGELKPVTKCRQLKHLHHSPLFWVGAVLFMLAISAYIFSEDLSLRLRARPTGFQQTAPL
jgi:hypothetical protein